mgnify:CR=1 FL=1
MIRITAKDAEGMMDAYSKVYAPPEEETPETEASVETSSSEEDEQTEYPIRDYTS